MGCLGHVLALFLRAIRSSLSEFFGEIVGVGSVADVGSFESVIGEEAGCIREGIEVNQLHEDDHCSWLQFDLGFPSAKSMSMHSREGHLGIHTIKFPGDESGLKEALRLAEYFIKEKHGRKAWAHVKPSITLGKDDENNPNLVKPDSRSGERRVLYGHLAAVADLDKVTFEIKKKVTIVSRREFKQSK